MKVVTRNMDAPNLEINQKGLSVKKAGHWGRARKSLRNSRSPS